RNLGRRLLHILVLGRTAKAVGLVIGVGITGLDATVEVHLTVAVIVVHRALGGVDRQGLVVGAQAVAVRVGIGEHAGLQHLVGRMTDADRKRVVYGRSEAGCAGAVG